MPKLKRIKEIQGYELGARDGKIGRCSDFLFDDRSWAVRYVVADTRKWLPGRKVLISPISIGAAIEATNILRVDLTKDQMYW
ncbi:PRC-barrel domain-containing protein [Desulfocastanea catecholica]